MARWCASLLPHSCHNPATETTHFRRNWGAGLWGFRPQCNLVLEPINPKSELLKKYLRAPSFNDPKHDELTPKKEG